MEAFTTMITPFTKQGQPDLPTAQKYVDWYFHAGLTGIFAVCQSSEIFYLTLEERTALARCVYTRAKQLEKQYGRRFTVVASGHISDDPAAQAQELNAIWAAGCDALILITNRLDIRNEGDSVFIANAEKLLAALPAEARLGLYECPYPYKRLVTPKILDWCMSTGRFDYMKDTCCDAEMLAQRAAQLRGSGFQLLNADGQTLLASLRAGAQGYCGVMCNFHPRLYAWLVQNYAAYPQKAEVLQAMLGTFCFTEGGLPYPLSAKYHMGLCGMPTENIARTRPAADLTPYARSCVEQMKLAADCLEKQLGLQ